MTLLVPVMLFGWIPLTILFFLVMRPRTAVLCSVIGSFLFLPMATYDLPGIPAYSKTTAAALGLILGGLISDQRGEVSFRWRAYDLPMAVWCFISPLASSVVNELGLYDGLSGVVTTFLNWGIFYWAGRKYFNDCLALRDLSIGMIIGGLIYIPLCLFELRMSPQLSNIFYGFFPHIFSQHVRYGGYRPIVFMQHGLMVALWMAQISIVTYWLWRNKIIRHIKGMPIALLALMLIVTAIFCKSVNGWTFLLVGIVCCFYFKMCRSVKLFQWILLLIPIYITLRVIGVLSAETIIEKASLFIDAERLESLSARLMQEDLFSAKAMQQPFFGWGLLSRGWPVSETSRVGVDVVDALWTLVLSVRGLVGLISVYLAMLLGPWLVYRQYHIVKINGHGYETCLVDAVVLSLVVIFFMIDALMNGMVSPVYILCSGALVSYTIVLRSG